MIGQTESNTPGQNERRHVCSRTGKISDEFADRLAALSDQQKVRAVIMPAPYLVDSGEGRRVRGEERQARVAEARTRTEETFSEVDAVLAQTGGRRLTERGNALGFIVVETTVEGITAIADLNWVGTVLEDQPIRPVHQAESSNERNRPQ
jgi:hypothetical protein